VTRTAGQSEVSAAANAAYFLQHLGEYHDSVAAIDTYKTLHNFISKEVEGVNELLDVGNGGVFAYDTSQLGSITAIDLFLEDLPPEMIKTCFPENARALRGSALALSANDNTFDMRATAVPLDLVDVTLHWSRTANWRLRDFAALA
jgi:hypothetical protein